MIILIKLFLNSKLDLIWTVKFVKQLFRIQIQKGRKVLLWNQVKSRMEACYSELALTRTYLIWSSGKNRIACYFLLRKLLEDKYLANWHPFAACSVAQAEILIGKPYKLHTSMTHSRWRTKNSWTYEVEYA